MVRRSLTRATRAAMLVALSTLAVSRPLAAQDGTTTLLVYKPDGSSTSPDTIVQSVRGTTTRIDAGAGRGERVAMIIDNATGTMTVLLASRHLYVQTTTAERDSLIARFKPQADSFARKFNKGTPGAPGAAPPAFTVKKTGTATVAGVSCTVYQVSASDATLFRAPGPDSLGVQEADLCVAPGAGMRTPDALTGGSSALAMASADPATQARMAMFKQVLANGTNGILRASTVRRGKPFVNLEVVRIDTAEPEASLFVVPAGYTKFTIPSFGGPP